MRCSLWGGFFGRLLFCVFGQAALGGAAWASTVYKCPGTPVLYTDSISAKEAKDQGCTSLDAAPVTVIAPTLRSKPGVVPSSTAPTSAAAGQGTQSVAGVRVDTAEQRSRDSDRKQILMAELKKEEQLLSSLKADFNNGEPERVGGEKNYQKYLDRVASMKAGIDRKEADITALKRELSKLP